MRRNAGAQYTMTFNAGPSVNALFGESFQLAGPNSYAVSDIANVSAESGLQTTNSDYVSRVAVNLDPNLSFIAKARLSEQTFAPEAVDLVAHDRIGPFQGSIQYSRYAPQPLIG